MSEGHVILPIQLSLRAVRHVRKFTLPGLKGCLENEDPFKDPIPNEGLGDQPSF